jgi:hypothetical protein
MMCDCTNENMARIGELAHEKQASISAEDWERVYQRSRVFALGCKDVDDSDDSDDTTNLLNDIGPEVSDADKSISMHATLRILSINLPNKKR